MNTLSALSSQWRKDADLLDSYGDANLAKACRRHADELDKAMNAASDELLDLAAASKESGFSADRLRHKVAAGEIPNAGKKGAPRIRRADLPLKPKRSAEGFDASAAASRLLRAAQ